MSIAHLLLQNLAVTVVCFLILWRVGVAVKDASIVDAYWALGMVILAWASFLGSGGPTPRRLLLTGICTAWGLRLGGYLFWRWRQHGADPRYTAMMVDAERERGWGFAKASLLLVFALQAPLQFLVCLPVQLGQVHAEPRSLGPLALAGATLSLIGLVFESVGDWQLARFKADPANRGRVMDRGLWRYTRHPNYFGDACMWWGLWLIAAETGPGLWALPGPLFLTFTLVRWSGVPMLEGRLTQTRPGYADYVRRTSGFLPWPPKAAAPQG
jgi:steroid 5-alpha reductase family enzyme